MSYDVLTHRPVGVDIYPLQSGFGLPDAERLECSSVMPATAEVGRFLREHDD